MGWITRLAIPLTTVAAGAALLTVTSGCNEHRVSFAIATGAVETLDKRNLGGGEKIDLLWVIDNSGSMCRSQGVLRNGIDEFVAILGELNLDFQIGITTTHMPDCEGVDIEATPWHPCALEPVAEAGHLQSTPQPIPGFDPACFHPVFADGDRVGEPITDRYDPVIENIEVAVECTEDPLVYQHLLNFGAQWEENFRCAVGIQGADDDCEGAPALEDLFPDPADYRPIPKVLRSEDYEDLEDFGRDFACASLVGTRGYGYEMGLMAAVTAVSPELTGGPDGDPGQFPNAGFIRPDAMTGVIFVGDENDCSHDGSLNEGTQCGVHNCTIEEQLGDQGALIPVDQLARDFKQNLAASRGVSEVNPNTILPASIHARYRKASDVPESCPQGGWQVPVSCASEMGVGWSGHRFEYFLREFDTFFPQPNPTNVDAPLRGLICRQDDFEQGLRELADFFASETGACYTDIFACQGFGDTCPDSPGGDRPGHCLPYADHLNDALAIVATGGVAGAELDAAIAELDALYEEDNLTGAADLELQHMAELLRRLSSEALATIENGLSANAGFYCDSGIEIRIGSPDGSSDPQALASTGYCLEGTIDTEPSIPGTCVVDPDRYWWAPCSDTRNGLQLAFYDAEQWINAIGGFDLYTRYATVPDAGGQDDQDGQDDNQGQ